jgi:hypothetical protein
MFLAVLTVLGFPTRSKSSWTILGIDNPGDKEPALEHRKQGQGHRRQMDREARQNHLEGE